jgi:hypothetical protein
VVARVGGLEINCPDQRQRADQRRLMSDLEFRGRTAAAAAGAGRQKIRPLSQEALPLSLSFGTRAHIRTQ